MAFLMELYVVFPPSQSFYQASSEGFPELKMVIAKMDASNFILTCIPIAYGDFHGDCKDGRIKFFLKPYFK